MRYRGSKICPDERTNERSGRADPKHIAFADAVGQRRHKKWQNGKEDRVRPGGSRISRALDKTDPCSLLALQLMTHERGRTIVS